jgi:hypothetical protein
MVFNIFRVIIAGYFHTHENVYQSTCIRQKATSVYRGMGLQYRMSARSPSVALNSEVAASVFGNVVDLLSNHCNFTNIIT